MRNWNYIQLFPTTSNHVVKVVEFKELISVLSDFEDDGDASFPAGYTYLGQFIDHDLTFLLENADIPGIDELAGMRMEARSRFTTLDTLTLARKPALDLDSVYGGGLPDSIVPFDKDTGQFILGEAEFGPDRDLRRNPHFQPLIGDHRNDNNLLVAQIQVVFMRFHNQIVKDLIATGETMPSTLFNTARNAVIKVYQYLVLHDFLKVVVSDPVYTAIIRNNDGLLGNPDRQNPTMSLEFAEAAFRLHSLVRPSYRLNDDQESASLNNLFELTGKEKNIETTTPPLLKNGDEVDWHNFFEFKNHGGSSRFRRAKKITFVVNRIMKNLNIGRNREVNMMELNILRGIIYSLCTGQHAVSALSHRHPQLSSALGLELIDGDTDFVLSKLSSDNSLRHHTPLWLYIMREAMIKGGGNRMGPLGGWLIAYALRIAAYNSDVRLSDPCNPRPKDLYEPLVAMAHNSGERAITFEDVIEYTGDKS